jgi:hypothetical protein
VPEVMDPPLKLWVGPLRGQPPAPVVLALVDLIELRHGRGGD